MRLALIARNFNTHTHRRLAEVAPGHGIELAMYDPMRIAVGKDSLYYDGRAFPECDVALMRTTVIPCQRDYILSITRFFESHGTAVINPSRAVEIACNKFYTFQHLHQTMIPAVPSLTLHSRSNMECAVESLGGFPLMLKFFHGTQGTGVILVETMDMLSALVDSCWALEGNILLQPFIAETKGECVRVLMLGERIIYTATMVPAPGNFRSNYLKGGTLRDERASEETIDLARKAKEACGLIFAGIDILCTAQGPMVLEVNSSPGVESIEKVLKVDLATEVVDALAEQFGSGFPVRTQRRK